MAVGKGSMERASKAVKKTLEQPKVAEPKAVETKEPVAAAKAEPKKAPAKKAPVKKAPAKKTVVANTSKQVMDKIVYQSSAQMLERDAEPNESFYVGDAMPVYYY